KVIPVQLYEAIFLFALCALLIYRFLKGKRYGMPIYMLTYGVWRFLIEYLRDDERGQTIVSFLTPSQLISVVLILGSAVVFALEYYAFRRQALRTAAAGEAAPSEEHPEEESHAEADSQSQTNDESNAD
ncbi:MAG: prolipoprotein diacylglyceryl transferase family protein, partial [Eubacteriales bacterium]